jgi:NTP pyrophosphatase (non-canonical NTP hydrolase)
LGELQHEVFKAIRKPDNFNRDAMAEEMADVHLMIGQIREGYNLHQQVEDWKQKKLHRLLEILSKHKKDQT